MHSSPLSHAQGILHWLQHKVSGKDGKAHCLCTYVTDLGTSLVNTSDEFEIQHTEYTLKSFTLFLNCRILP